jgi:hypothetical protein
MVVAGGASDSEIAEFAQGLTETCMSCHGGPGVRQAAEDGATFRKEFLFIEDDQDPNFKYGALARDGINCTLCHHIGDGGTEADFFKFATTGRFPMSPKSVIYGPYQSTTLHPEPMEHGVGFTPEYGPHVDALSTSSRLCGHCHSIDLPVIDAPTVPGTPPSAAFPIGFNDPDYPFPIHAEQATYTEWLNSEFQTIFGTTSETAQSCQHCHMQETYDGSPIETIIASIQDASYPEILWQLPDLFLEARGEFGRHQFVGLNVPLLQLFNQFESVLGVSKANYMSGLSTALANTIAAMLDQAANRTATLDVAASVQSDDVVVDVTVTNLTGHRFPSGVAFRRAWLEVLLVDTATGDTVWGSGRTNNVGVIVDQNGAPLPTEFFKDNVWQEHHETIDSQSQVQIYEEVALNSAGDVTYSFLRRGSDPKDNRLLPRGWTAEGPSNTISAAIIESTHPKGVAALDPSYADGSGTDSLSYVIPLPVGPQVGDLEVRVTLNYQSTSPAFLQEKFTWSKDGPATKRLYYLMSNLNTSGTPIENWKLSVQTASASVE